MNMEESVPKPIPSFRGSHGGPRNRGVGRGGGGRGPRGRGRGGPPGRGGQRGRGGGGNGGGGLSRGGGMNRPPRGGIPSGLSMRPPNARGNRGMGRGGPSRGPPRGRGGGGASRGSGPLLPRGGGVPKDNQNRGGYGGMNRPNVQAGGPPPKRGRWDPAGNSFSGGRREYQAPGNSGYGEYGAAPDVQSTYLTGTDYQMNSQPPAEDYTGGYKMPSDTRTSYRGGYTAATTYPSSYNGGGYGESSYDGRGNYESYTNPAGAVSSYGKDYGQGGSRPGSDDRYGYDSYGGAPSYNQSRDNYAGSTAGYGPPRGGGAPPPRHY